MFRALFITVNRYQDRSVLFYRRDLTICSQFIYKNVYFTARQYDIGCPEKGDLSKKACECLAVFLSETGNVHHIPAPVRQRSARSEDRVINILAYMERDPHLSVRKLPSGVGISKFPLHSILVDSNLYS